MAVFLHTEDCTKTGIAHYLPESPTFRNDAKFSMRVSTVMASVTQQQYMMILQYCYSQTLFFLNDPLALVSADDVGNSLFVCRGDREQRRSCLFQPSDKLLTSLDVSLQHICTSRTVTRRVTVLR